MNTYEVILVGRRLARKRSWLAICVPLLIMLKQYLNRRNKMKDYEWIIDSAMVALLVIFVANMIGGAI